ncbi:hypothetical protein Misp06_03981 [Microbulbifer sp. NBRC 101763]|uniref:hypothetical protein n=1 Tax=Microbulbifer TaxID=48073 RepID=UPI00035F69FE|nr:MULTISPECIES: hypothetical protein [Microbulbifer]WHI50533.1 hypothetical protein P3339_19155 [Microbulbifer sp. MLAF003]
MRKKSLISVFFGLGLLIGCASEQQQGQNIAPSSQNTNEVESNTSNQLICKSRAITGSRFKQKTCMTAEEWKRMSRESSNMVNNQNRKGVLGNPEGG